MPITRHDAVHVPDRLLQLYAGLILYGVTLALQIRAGLGLDPWDVFPQGISDKTGLSFGTISDHHRRAGPCGLCPINALLRRASGP